MAKGKNKIELVYHYYQEDFTRLIICLEEIRKRLGKNENVPAVLIKEFLGYFEAPVKAEALERSNEMVLAQIATLKYFSGKKDYWFRVTRREPDPLWQHFFGEDSEEASVKRHKVTYSLEGFINSIFARLSTAKHYSVSKDKYELASFIYDNFRDYIKPLTRRPISERAMIVVTGFILVQFGYLRTEERWAEKEDSYRYYNEYLYDNLKRLSKKKKK